MSNTLPLAAHPLRAIVLLVTALYFAVGCGQKPPEPTQVDVEKYVSQYLSGRIAWPEARSMPGSPLPDGSLIRQPDRPFIQRPSMPPGAMPPGMLPPGMMPPGMRPDGTSSQELPTHFVDYNGMPPGIERPLMTPPDFQDELPGEEYLIAQAPYDRRRPPKPVPISVTMSIMPPLMPKFLTRDDVPARLENVQITSATEQAGIWHIAFTGEQVLEENFYKYSAGSKLESEIAFDSKEFRTADRKLIAIPHPRRGEFYVLHRSLGMGSVAEVQHAKGDRLKITGTCNARHDETGWVFERADVKLVDEFSRSLFKADRIPPGVLIVEQGKRKEAAEKWCQRYRDFLAKLDVEIKALARADEKRAAVAEAAKESLQKRMEEATRPGKIYRGAVVLQEPRRRPGSPRVSSSVRNAPQLVDFKFIPSDDPSRREMRCITRSARPQSVEFMGHVGTLVDTRVDVEMPDQSTKSVSLSGPGITFSPFNPSSELFPRGEPVVCLRPDGIKLVAYWGTRLVLLEEVNLPSHGKRGHKAFVNGHVAFLEDLAPLLEKAQIDDAHAEAALAGCQQQLELLKLLEETAWGFKPPTFEEQQEYQLLKPSADAAKARVAEAQRHLRQKISTKGYREDIALRLQDTLAELDEEQNALQAAAQEALRAAKQ